MKRIDPLTYLARTDKWYLGGGNRLLWTPPFPVWLTSPGFWDKAHYYNFEIEPLFTWTLLDEDGREVRLQAGKRDWTPARLRQRYRAHGMTLVEEKYCLPNDLLGSSLTIKNTTSSARRLHCILWTTQPHYPEKKTTWLSGITVRRGMVSIEKHIQREGHPHFHFGCALGMDRNIASYTVNLSEGSVVQPHWHLTPFVEKFRNGKLPGDRNITGISSDGLLHIALHTIIDLPAKVEEKVVGMFAAAPTRITALKQLSIAARQRYSVRESEKSWRTYFASVPYFACSDEFITRYYWYRWYGLRLLTIDGKEGNYRFPAVCEGIGYFRAPISYSAMCHIFENRWMSDPTLARGSMRTFIANQRHDGGFRGYIDVHHYRQEMFYHANWGDALLALEEIHPSMGFLEEVYSPLVRYVDYFDRERDSEGSGLFDIQNHYETGQEYMSRYLAVNPHADRDNWGEVFRLKGVDVTVYLYRLKRALAAIAATLGKADDARRWRLGAEKIKTAVRERMWDAREEMFFDVDPASGKRTMVKAAVCFYPYMTDIVSAKHLAGLKKHLFNPREFWSRFPIPSTAMNDASFSAGAEWKGKRMNCPWNGRVWPMTNSHIAEVLATAARLSGDGRLRNKAGEFLQSYIRMMFFDGDPRTPNCFEHYHPASGIPSMYRGVDDYQHSWIVDLILKYVGGIRIEGEYLVIDPLLDLKKVEVENLRIQGIQVKINRTGEKTSLTVGGKMMRKALRGGEQIRVLLR